MIHESLVYLDLWEKFTKTVNHCCTKQIICYFINADKAKPEPGLCLQAPKKNVRKLPCQVIKYARFCLEG